MAGTDQARPRGRQLGRVIPGLLAAVLLVDLALRLAFAFRFVPIDPLTFRPSDALLAYRPVGATFEPNRHYYNARSYGDVAGIGNLREPREYRPVRFTTDALGYRNAAHAMNGEIGAILAGDSFAAGVGANDDKTLSSRLSALGPCVVYNAASEARDVVPDRILAAARRLTVRNRLVIRVYAEDAEIPPPRETLLRKLAAQMPEESRGITGRLRGILTVSPLQILSERALRALDDDRILPNGYATNAVKATVSNGDSMAFWTPEVQNFTRRRPVALAYWRWLRDELRKARFDLRVVLVPSKYTVYRPFLVDQAPDGREAGGYLDRLERALRAAGIPVLNLTPLLSAEAARQLKHERYLYWPDDVHWNARGIALAAAAIQETWPLPEASCGPPHVQARKGP